jgi:uncharacterized protein (TIGR03000 family)
MKRFVVLSALGVFGMLAAMPAPANARYFAGYWGGPRIFRPYWGGYGWFGRPWRANYYYWNGGYWNGGTGCNDCYTGYYPQEQAALANAVTIQMHVPQDARVWIEGESTSQTGTERTFVSPSLAPSSQYVYHIRAQWDENGKVVKRQREVKVYAGDRINLDLTS